MPTKCCVPYCRGNYNGTTKVSVFSFPKDEMTLKKWLIAIKRENLRITKYTKICEKHFVSQYIQTATGAFDEKTGRYIVAKLENPRLHKDAVPTIFPGYPTDLQNCSNETLILNNTVRIKQESTDDSTGNEESFISSQPIIQHCFSTYSSEQAELCTNDLDNLNPSNSCDNDMKKLSQTLLVPKEEEEVSNFVNEHEYLPISPTVVIQDDFSSHLITQAELLCANGSDNLNNSSSSGIEAKRVSQIEIASQEKVPNFVNQYQHFTVPSVNASTRFDLLCKNWAEKMKSLENDQRIFAEKLINDVFFLAELNQLGHECQIITTNSFES